MSSSYLLSSRTFQTGVVHLVYALADSAGDGSYEDAKKHLPHDG